MRKETFRSSLPTYQYVMKSYVVISILLKYLNESACKERHTYVTASKASIAVTLDNRLIREDSQRSGDFFKHV